MSDGMKIVSGGQTGADRSGLDAAMLLGLEHGGMVPKGRRADDGKVPDKYQLEEHTSSAYPPRTRINIASADATLIIAYEEKIPMSRGTCLTAELCEKSGKPWMAVDPRSEDHQEVRDWLIEHGVQVLNVAGPRECICPGIQELGCKFLVEVLGPILLDGSQDT